MAKTKKVFKLGLTYNQTPITITRDMSFNAICETLKGLVGKEVTWADKVLPDPPREEWGEDDW